MTHDNNMRHDNMTHGTGSSAMTDPQGPNVRSAMLTDFLTLSPQQSATAAVEALMSGGQLDFPVVDRGRLVGLLRRTDLLRAEASDGKVGDFMLPVVPTAAAEEAIDLAARRMRSAGCLSIVVLERGSVIGLLPAERIAAAEVQLPELLPRLPPSRAAAPRAVLRPRQAA